MRTAQFTSSEIHRLMSLDRAGTGFGKPALEYIREKNMEKRLGRELGNEATSRPTSWGKFVESYVFEILPLEYRLESKTRFQHKVYEEWSGSPDVLTEEIVGDIKCPFTLKSFCEVVDALTESVEEFKKIKPEWYWQLVSNAILAEKSVAELIMFAPYLRELPAIKERAADYDGNQNDIAFLNWAQDNELPYLIEGLFYKNINIFRFNVPVEDKRILSENVFKAIQLL